MAKNSQSNLGFSQLPFGKVIRDTTVEEQRESNSRGVQMIVISKPYLGSEKKSEEEPMISSNEKDTLKH